MTDPTVDLGIAGFRDVHLIGRGGFAMVYRAYDERLERIVAVKVLKTTDSRATTRLLAEARTMGPLSDNPCVVDLLGTGATDTGQPFLVMELCENGSADQLLKQRRADGQLGLGLLEAVEVGIAIATALQAAHTYGIIHGDVKPANVLRSDYGWRLTDFGISRFRAESSEDDTPTGLSVYYSAPEVLSFSAPSEQSDLYSLGASLFTLIEGARPFEGATREDVMARVHAEPAPSLSARFAPPELQELVAGLLVKDPAARVPPTARAVLDVLRHIEAEFLGDDDETVDLVPQPVTPAVLEPPRSTSDPAGARPAVAPAEGRDEQGAPAPKPRRHRGRRKKDSVDPTRTVNLAPESTTSSGPSRWTILGLLVSFTLIGTAIGIYVTRSDDRDATDQQILDVADQIRVNSPATTVQPITAADAEPSALKLSATHPGRATLSWRSPSDRPVDYVFYRGTFEIDPGTKLARSAPSTASLVAEDGTDAAGKEPLLRTPGSQTKQEFVVDPSKYSCFRVVAIQSGEPPEITPSQQICTPVRPPKPPAIVAVTPTGPTASVTWKDNSLDESGFFVLQLIDAAAGPRVVSQSGPLPPDTSGASIQLQPEGGSIVVVAVNAVNASSYPVGDQLPSTDSWSEAVPVT